MKKFLVAFVSLCAVASCSGGGGGSPPGVMPPDPPSRPLVDSPEPRSNFIELQSFYNEYLIRSLAYKEFRVVKLPEGYANIYGGVGATAAARPGDEVTIGFVDSGLDTEHPVFEDKTIDVEYFGNVSEGSDLADEGYSHGTSVASIAAGVRQNWDVSLSDGYVESELGVFTSEGVAPGASIKMFAIDFAGFIENLNSASNAAISDNVDILNISLALKDGGIISDSLYENVNSVDHMFSGLIKTQTQSEREEKTIFVWAAGNLNGSSCNPDPNRESCPNENPNVAGEESSVRATSPGPLAGLMYRIPELRSHSVAVVAVKLEENGKITDFSNRCGVAADWCIAAPGEDIGVAYSTRNPDGSIKRGISVSIEDTVSDPRGSGTSFAAPIVSGGLALIKQRFRSQLDNVQILSRMFMTADKSGIYADRDIYGQGLLDIGAATEPVGQVRTSGRAEFLNNENGWQFFAPLSDTLMEPGEAFGDGFGRAFAGKEIAGFDSLGAPFWYPLEAFMLKTGRKRAVQRQLHSFMDDFSTRKTASAQRVRVTGGEVSALLFAEKKEWEKEAVFEKIGQIPEIRVSMARGAIRDPNRLSKSGGHLGFIDSPLSFGVQYGNLAVFAFTSDEREKRPARGAVVSYRLPNLPLNLRSGYISESKSALGTTAQGGFGGLSASTVFAKIGWDYGFGGWKIAADAEMGISYSGIEPGLVSDVSQLTTSSFSASLIRKLSDDSEIKISVSSPIRIESGQMDLIIPAGRTPKGAILKNRISANLEPSGRQIDFGTQITTRIPVGKLSIRGVASREPGHDKNAGSLVSLLVGYGLEI